MPCVSPHCFATAVAAACVGGSARRLHVVRPCILHTSCDAAALVTPRLPACTQTIRRATPTLAAFLAAAAKRGALECGDASAGADAGADAGAATAAAMSVHDGTRSLAQLMCRCESKLRTHLSAEQAGPLLKAASYVAAAAAAANTSRSRVQTEYLVKGGVVVAEHQGGSAAAAGSGGSGGGGSTPRRLLTRVLSADARGRAASRTASVVSAAASVAKAAASRACSAVLADTKPAADEQAGAAPKPTRRVVSFERLRSRRSSLFSRRGSSGGGDGSSGSGSSGGGGRGGGGSGGAEVQYELHRLLGKGPACVRAEHVATYFKYDSSGRKFAPLPSKHLTMKTDAISLDMARLRRAAAVAQR